MPKASAKKHSIRSVVRQVTSTPWAILPSKLEEICELLTLRRHGLEFTEEEIQERIAVNLDLRSQYGDGQAGGKPYVTTKEGVAIVPLEGLLAPKMNLMLRISGGTSTQQFAAAVRRAGDDPKVRAIVIAVDSPGGSALGTAEAAKVVREVARMKPVVVVAVGTMASAAYYIGSAAREVVASPSAMVGSIGTVLVHLDTSKADQDEGLTYSVIKFGKHKADGNSYEQLSDQGRETLQERVDDYGRQFVDEVAAHRGISAAEVEAKFGQGKVFIAAKAVDLGLADRIGTLDEIIAEQGQGSPMAGGSAPSSDLTKEKTMDPRVMQALIKRGLISAEATKETAQAVLAAFYSLRGKTVPDSVEVILADLAEKSNAQEPAGQATSTPPAPTPDPETVRQAQIDERTRIIEIETRGRLLGVDQATIDAAKKDGTSVEKFLLKATEKKADEERAVGRVEPGRAGQDKFGAVAVDALCLRRELDLGDRQPAEGAEDMQYASLVEIAKAALQVCGERPFADESAIAEQALAAAGTRPVIIHGVAGAAPVHSPGSFPGILSALANRSLAAQERYAETTFQDWASRVDDARDFRPKTIWAVGEFGELPEHKDGDAFEQSTMSHEGAYLMIDSYGDEVQFTPRMLQDDDLGAFLEAVGDKRDAHDATLNRLCINLLIGNVTLWFDNTALFHSDHGNDRTAGNPPSDTELGEMRVLLRKQKGVSNKRNLSYTLKHLLVPSKLETATEKLLAAVQVVPAGTSDAQIFRRRVRWSVDPMLDAYSEVKYFGFGPARAKAIVYCYQKGYRKMRLRRYLNPSTNSLHFQAEGRFCAVVRNYRGVARNAGTGAS